MNREQIYKKVLVELLPLLAKIPSAQIEEIAGRIAGGACEMEQKRPTDNDCYNCRNSVGAPISEACKTCKDFRNWQPVQPVDHIVDANKMICETCTKRQTGHIDCMICRWDTNGMSNWSPVESKFNGQCEHGEAIGQRCMKCEGSGLIITEVEFHEPISKKCNCKTKEGN